jgi:hypothetical protein
MYLFFKNDRLNIHMNREKYKPHELLDVGPRGWTSCLTASSHGSSTGLEAENSRQLVARRGDFGGKSHQLHINILNINLILNLFSHFNGVGTGIVQLL